MFIKINVSIPKADGR